MKYNLDEEINTLNRVKLPIKNVIPSIDTICEYERVLGFKFSDDYRKFIRNVGYSMSNGLDILDITQDINSPRNMIEYTRMAREAGVPMDWIPISEDNGDYYCLLPDGKVVFWSHNGSSNEWWENLAAWIHEVLIEGN